MASRPEPTKPEWPMNVMIFEPSDDPLKIQVIKDSIKMTEDPQKEVDQVWFAKMDAQGNAIPEPDGSFEMKKTGNTIMTHTSANHFTTKHFALMFAPGTYKDCDFEIGYYVQMLGLGKTAKYNDKDAVTFSGLKSGPYVTALNKDLPYTKSGTIAQPNSGLCLDTFWRSVENFSTENLQWAVSQAAPVRRIHVTNQLMFGDGAAFSSGGFLANARVDGQTNYAANQQWFSRAVSFGGDAVGGAWNIVFSGCTDNVPSPGQQSSSQLVITVQERPEVRIEKPFITRNSFKDFELVVPGPTRDFVTGPVLGEGFGDVRSFANVKLGKPILPLDNDGNYIEHDDATYNMISPEDIKLNDELQKALDEGKDLVLCPGIFFLYKTLEVKKPNQVILGLGLPALVSPQDGSPSIRVKAYTPGVRIAGIMLEASVHNGKNSSNADGVRSLLEYGEPDAVGDLGDPNNPGLLADIFARVGGSNLDRSVSTNVMIRIHSGNVVGDNLWLWRADHVRLRPGELPNDPNFPLYHQVWIKNEAGQIVNECMVDTALEVRGDNVKMYGLFCEHTVQHQLVWKGHNGSVSFYQCELPYDLDTEFAEQGYVGYNIHDHVETHVGRGLGVYSNFQVNDVYAPSGMKYPSKEGVLLESPFTVYLNNKGGIKSVVKVGDMKMGDEVRGPPTPNQLARPWIGVQMSLL